MTERLEEAAPAMIDLRTLADDEVAPPPGWAGSAPAAAPAVPEPSWDQPGGLDIKEKRSWHTWHLLSTGLVAVLVGMAIGHAGSKPSTSAASKGGGLFKLPDASGPTSTTPTSVDAETGTTTSSTSPTATTLAAETPATGVAKVLLDKKGTGPLAATPFTVKGGTWRIGWAYDCTQSGTADGSGPFQIAVAPASGTAAIAVDEAGARSKKGVTTQTVSGPLTIEVRTACRWAVKVTGIPG